jgi:transcription antitermination factor NusG
VKLRDMFLTTAENMQETFEKEGDNSDNHTIHENETEKEFYKGDNVIIMSGAYKGKEGTFIGYVYAESGKPLKQVKLKPTSIAHKRMLLIEKM